jgi:hypothetical protein
MREKGVAMAARCFCGCGEKVPWRLQVVTHLGQAIRQRRLDLENLLDAGLRSPRAEQLIRVMAANERVLARSIHRNEPLTAEVGGRTSDVLLAYELLFGAEALTRAWVPYSDEVLRDQLGVDLGELEISLNAGTAATRPRGVAERPVAFRRRSAFPRPM